MNSIDISLKFDPNGPISNLPALVQIHPEANKPQWASVSVFNVYTFVMLYRLSMGCHIVSPAPV